MQLIKAETPLETARLILEPLNVSHAPFLYEALQDERIYTYIPENPPLSLETLATRYQKLASRRSPDETEIWLNWAVRLREGLAYIGTLQASIYEDATAYIAYVFFPPFWRQGYAKEGCQRLLKLLLGDYQVQVVKALIDTRNLASVRLIESLGFQRVSMTLHADTFKGAISDEYLYKLSASQPF